MCSFCSSSLLIALHKHRIYYFVFFSLSVRKSNYLSFHVIPFMRKYYVSTLSSAFIFIHFLSFFSFVSFRFSSLFFGNPKKIWSLLMCIIVTMYLAHKSSNITRNNTRIGKWIFVPTGCTLRIATCTFPTQNNCQTRKSSRIFSANPLLSHISTHSLPCKMFTQCIPKIVSRYLPR